MQALNVAKLRRIQEASALIDQFLGDISKDTGLTDQGVLLGILQEKARGIKNASTRILDVKVPETLAVREQQIVNLVNELAPYKDAANAETGDGSATAEGELTVSSGAIKSHVDALGASEGPSTPGDPVTGSE
jgi:hypothetical protein